VYSEKLLMMDRGIVRNIELYSKNKFDKLVHLVGFIITLLSNYVTFGVIMFFIKSTACWRIICLVNFDEFESLP